MLTVDGLVKSFPGAGPEPVVRDLSLHVEPGKLYTLLGPSGCGKTTTLRCIAGLERPDAGQIAVAGRVLFSARGGVEVAAHRRGLGMVFQSYGLWPHMTVFETVAFPLLVGPRSSRPGRRALRERVERALATVQLAGLEDRRAPELSGGQQQRLALARALVMEPPLLLMDEPLSNLDAVLREGMRLELKRMQREIGVTAVYVTHDQAEALALSNVVAVMREGRIEQEGRPRDIYERPRSRYVAEFLGAANLIDGEVAGGVVHTAQGALAPGPGWPSQAGAAVLVAVRPEALAIEEDAGRAGGPGRWRGVVRARAFHGDSVEHVVEVQGAELRVSAPSSVSVPPGQSVVLVVDSAACSLIPLS
jgi:iron(III) transport system ATP-binding protein